MVEGVASTRGGAGMEGVASIRGGAGVEGVASIRGGTGVAGVKGVRIGLDGAAGTRVGGGIKVVGVIGIEDAGVMDGLAESSIPVCFIPSIVLTIPNRIEYLQIKKQFKAIVKNLLWC